MLFWMRSETYMSNINLQRGKLRVENRKSREKKRICSEVSVNSPRNSWSQSRRRNGRLWCSSVDYACRGITRSIKWGWTMGGVEWANGCGERSSLRSWDWLYWENKISKYVIGWPTDLTDFFALSNSSELHNPKSIPWRSPVWAK